jgi:hypothetical protein
MPKKRRDPFAEGEAAQLANLTGKPFHDFHIRWTATSMSNGAEGGKSTPSHPKTTVSSKRTIMDYYGVLSSYFQYFVFGNPNWNDLTLDYTTDVTAAEQPARSLRRAEFESGTRSCLWRQWGNG